ITSAGTMRCHPFRGFVGRCRGVFQAASKHDKGFVGLVMQVSRRLIATFQMYGPSGRDLGWQRSRLGPQCAIAFFVRIDWTNATKALTTSGEGRNTMSR